VSILLFAASLTQIAYCSKVGANIGCVDAWSALLFGWFGMLAIGGPAISCLANIFLPLSWIMQFTAASKYTLGVAVFSSLVMLSFATVAVFSSLVMLSFATGGEVLIDEAGHHSKIISIGLGYWLWLMSALILVIGNGITLFLEKNGESK
jgi:hypothetical protein